MVIISGEMNFVSVILSSRDGDDVEVAVIVTVRREEVDISLSVVTVRTTGVLMGIAETSGVSSSLVEETVIVALTVCIIVAVASMASIGFSPVLNTTTMVTIIAISAKAPAPIPMRDIWTQNGTQTMM